MSDWREEQRRRDQEQREKDRDREENRRHRERMALEEKRDRVSSMRVRGATEDEIKKSEFRRGCFPLLAIIVAGIAYLLFGNIQSPHLNSTSSVQEEEISAESNRLDPGGAQIDAEVPAVNVVNPAPQSSPAVTEPSAADAGEIKFVSEPVVQPLPSPSAESGEDVKEGQE